LDENRKDRTAPCENDEEIKTIFAYLKKLLIQETKPRNPIGFRVSDKK